MDPDVGTNNIHTIKTTPISTTDSHVVCFAIGDRVHNEVEHGGVDEDDVVDGKVVGLLDTQETGAIALAVLVILVSKTCR